MPDKKKYEFVILKSLEFGDKFFSTYTSDEDVTRLQDGTLAYKVIGYADSIEEAQIKLYGRSYKLPA